MRNFRRTLLKALAFLGCILLITVAITEPYFQSDVFHYQDAAVRDAYAGTLDTLVCGSSHAFRAIQPKVLDQRLGCTSYNLSTSLMTMAGRYELLKKELKRNPVELVILDASYNSLTRNRAEEGPEGDIYQLGRYTNIFERASYFFRHIRLNEYWRVYYDTLERSKDTYVHLLHGGSLTGKEEKYENRGYLGAIAARCPTVSPEEYHTEKVFESVDPECVKYMDKMISMCQERGIAVIVVVAPVSQSTTLRFQGLDDFYSYLRDYCARWEVPLFDMNLFKGKTNLFPDATHYYDELHMSADGAWSATHYICDVVELWKAGREYDTLFYSSYTEAEEAALAGTDLYNPWYKLP